VLESVRSQQAGIATGISSTSRYLGSILGSSILVYTLGSAPIDVNKFQVVFLEVALAAFIAMLMSWGINNERSQW
jgi:sugar phosphate permease